MKWLTRGVWLLAVVVVAPLLVAACSSDNFRTDWRTADRSSAGLAPDPSTTPEAVVQVYAARAFNWRGIFAVHSWIATKARGAGHYTVHEVLGWRARHGGTAVSSHRGLPDRNWYGARPEVLREVRGPEAQALIPLIETAVSGYPHAQTYVLWPGPNSNTFVAHVARSVPGLGVDMPPTAIGKDYLADGSLFGPAPSNTGYQFSLFGLLGVTLAVEEGVEVNLLSLGLGIDPLDLAVRLPGVGRVSAL
jgi:hypothetical protein